jgi:hypothetical protein
MILTFKNKNKRVVSFQGRNGAGKQIGIEILPIGEPNPQQVVTFSPINSKGDVANCMIDLPVADIPEFIAELQNIHTKATSFTRYFKLNVFGRYSTFIKTETVLPPESSLSCDVMILELAIAAKVIAGGDAKDIMNGNGDIEEMTREELIDDIPGKAIHPV